MGDTHEADHGEKKSTTQRVWRVVAILIVGGFGLAVAIHVLAYIIKMIFDGTARILAGIGSGFESLADVLLYIDFQLGVLRAAFNVWALRAILVLLAGAIAIFIFRTIKSLMGGD